MYVCVWVGGRGGGGGVRACAYVQYSYELEQTCEIESQWGFLVYQCALTRFRSARTPVCAYVHTRLWVFARRGMCDCINDSVCSPVYEGKQTVKKREIYRRTEAD